MKLNSDLHMLPLEFTGPLGTMVLNLSLIVDPVQGVTLVDTSMPGQVEAIEKAMAAEGFDIDDVKRIIVTHQDIDHIGSLAALKARTGSKILAHATEAPYVSGEKPLVKYPSQERLDQNPGMKEMYDQIGFAPADELLEDGQLLDVAGGIRVIHTPGHTPGHISLFLERSKTLISGDALVSENGQLAGPLQRATPDYPEAIRSVQRLAALPEVHSVVTYHGGLVSEDPLGKLGRVAAGLTEG